MESMCMVRLPLYSVAEKQMVSQQYAHTIVYYNAAVVVRRFAFGPFFLTTKTNLNHWEFEVKIPLVQ